MWAMNPLVPAVDPAPLPGPIWLLHLLWVTTFTVHLLLVNAVLGGTILSAVALVRGRAGRGLDAKHRGSPSRPERGLAGRDLAAWFASINTWAIPFAITFAIAPLLFMQLLYGRFFYSATILLAGAWLTMLGLLTVAYYLNYPVKRRIKDGGTPSLLVLVQALLFLTIAGIQVAVSLLHQRPDRWGAVSDHPWSVLFDPAFVPRYLHFVFAAVAVSGSVLAWWRMRRSELDGAGAGSRGDPGGGTNGPSPAVELDGDVRFGLLAALGATALQLPVGFWMLFALPRDVLLGFMKGGPGTMMPLTLGILTGVGAIVVLALCLSPLAKPRLVRHAMELLCGTMILMVLTRHQLRRVYLAVENRGVPVAVTPQWGAIGLFLLCFLGAAVLTGVVLRRAIRDRPGPGEDAA
jgi:hypothetical protein